MLQDNYVHMYPLATRGQEDIALLPLDSVNMDGIEGEKNTSHSQMNLWLQIHVDPNW